MALSSEKSRQSSRKSNTFARALAGLHQVFYYTTLQTEKLQVPTIKIHKSLPEQSHITILTTKPSPTQQQGWLLMPIYWIMLPPVLLRLTS